MSNLIKLADIKGMSLKEILSLNIIYEGSEFRETLYYAPKLKTSAVMNKEELDTFLTKNKNQTFLLCKFYSTTTCPVFAYIDNQENDLCFNFLIDTGNGKLSHVGECHLTINGYGVPKVYSPYSKQGINVILSQPNYQGSRHLEFSFFEIFRTAYPRAKWIEHSSTKHQFTIIGDCGHMFGDSASSGEVARALFQYNGDTRCFHETSYYGFSVRVGDIGSEILALPVEQRYALERNRLCYDYNNTEVVCADTLSEKAEASEETRVTIQLRSMLEDISASGCRNTSNKRTRYRYNNDIVTKDVILLSDPIPGHRRPIYHVYRGVLNGGHVDVVEICRGELQMIDLTPVSCYILIRESMAYERVTHTTLKHVKDSIFNSGDITYDPESLIKYTDRRSINPMLLRAMSAYGKDYPTAEEVSTFNRVKFGALFAEQLIKADRKELALHICSHINTYADNMAARCNSLDSILPGCDIYGNSISATLKMSKPWLNLLWSLLDSTASCRIVIERFKFIYKLLKYASGNNTTGNISSAAYAHIQDGVYLYEQGLSTINLQNGTVFDICSNKELTRITAKMYRRIKASGLMYEGKRYYTEILQVYLQLKEFGWVPEEKSVFIEFNLGTDPMDNLRSREAAAQVTYQTYKEAIDKKTRENNEKKYQTRLSTLAKLETKEPIFFGQYEVVSPKNIYGVNVDYSLEKEGNDQGHCVFNAYASDCINGRYTVLYLRNTSNPTRSLVTIGVTAEGRINQTYGFHNRPINPDEAQAIVEWATLNKGKIHFSTDCSSSVAPGGWEKSVAIPSLPKPEEKWIKQLKTVG